MMNYTLLFICVWLFIISISIASAAHFIVGYVNDAGDGTSPNDREVYLYNPLNGQSDNVSDIIGANGNSGSDNIYLIDCELLSTPCQVGDEIRVELLDNGSDYIASFVNLTVSGAGFTVAPNMTLTSPPEITSLVIDDEITAPSGEIDLTPLNTTFVTCEGVITDYDGDSISNVTSEFFDATQSFFGDVSDNNHHYSNSSCFVNSTYGNSNESYYECGYAVEYYAHPGTWNCSVSATDSSAATRSLSNSTTINTLLAISVPEQIEYGVVNASMVSSEVLVNVTNAGNVQINLSLSGYGQSIGDGFAMNCSGGGGIPIGYEKYNLTSSNPGALLLNQFETLYQNLTSDSVVREFNLFSRTDDVSPNLTETDETYWRMYLPPGFGGTCTGNVVFGAALGPGS